MPNMNLKISLNYKFLKRDIVSKKQTHRGDKLVVISGEKEGGGAIQEKRIKRFKLLCTK